MYTWCVLESARWGYRSNSSNNGCLSVTCEEEDKGGRRRRTLHERAVRKPPFLFFGVYSSTSAQLRAITHPPPPPPPSPRHRVHVDPAVWNKRLESFVGVAEASLDVFVAIFAKARGVPLLVMGCAC